MKMCRETVWVYQPHQSSFPHFFQTYTEVKHIVWVRTSSAAATKISRLQFCFINSTLPSREHPTAPPGLTSRLGCHWSAPSIAKIPSHPSSCNSSSRWACLDPRLCSGSCVVTVWFYPFFSGSQLWFFIEKYFPSSATRLPWNWPHTGSCLVLAIVKVRRGTPGIYPDEPPQATCVSMMMNSRFCARMRLL